MATSVNLVTIFLACILITHPYITEAAVSCGSVAAAMRPCIYYLQKGGRVPPACCGGVKKLVSAASTPKDRQTACSCLKSAAGSIKGINLSYAASLPRACGVRIPYAISPNTNCATVK